MQFYYHVEYFSYQENWIYFYWDVFTFVALQSRTFKPDTIYWSVQRGFSFFYSQLQNNIKNENYWWNDDSWFLYLKISRKLLKYVLNRYSFCKFEGKISKWIVKLNLKEYVCVFNFSKILKLMNLFLRRLPNLHKNQK